MNKSDMEKEKDIVNANTSKSLVPPEAILAGIETVEQQPRVAPSIEPQLPTAVTEISTPKGSGLNGENAPLSSLLEPIDLNIVNLESVSDIRQTGERARSSPSFKVSKFNF
jgi:hypothetical protein